MTMQTMNEHTHSLQGKRFTMQVGNAHHKSARAAEQALSEQSRLHSVPKGG